MGKIKKGILGGFSGTVGTVVGANWRGMDIIRSRPNASGKVPTEAQVLQRSKFGAATLFLKPISTISAQYFGTPSGTRSRFNMATSYTLTDVVDYEGGTLTMRYNKVLITRGDLVGFQDLGVQAEVGGRLVYAWADNSAQGNASADDVFATAVYCESADLWHLAEAGTRSSGNAEVALPAAMAGNAVQVYAYFRKSDAGGACTSLYLGQQSVLP